MDNFDHNMNFITQLLESTPPLLENIGTLPIGTATELYAMYDSAAKTATGIITKIDPNLRVRLCAIQDEILERIVDDMPQLSVPCNKIYSPAIKDKGNNARWTNTDLLKDCGLVVYLLGKLLDRQPMMLYGSRDENYPYLDILQGLEFHKTDAPADDLSVYYRHLAENYNHLDTLILYGLYIKTPDYLCMYRNLRPDAKVYLALDLHTNWMAGIPWDSDVERKALSQCDIVATSCSTLRDALNKNPKVSFPCRWFTNGFYNPTGLPVVADPSAKENIILTVGRIGTKQKNNLELMTAFAIASESIPGWSLRLAGPIEPGFKHDIDEFYKQYPKMKERVVFTDAITDKRELYQEYARAKIFALSSVFEGFPNVYAEALFHGCMFITSDIDAAGDMTQAGQLGTIYKRQDTSALADAMVKMAKNADNKNFEEYIPKALEYAHKYYDWNRNVKKLAYMLFHEEKVL